LRLKFVRTTEESMKLNRVRSGAIIIAGSGMCEGGRMVHHLKHNLWRPENSLIFVGYQAEGTLGRRIVDGDKRVRVLGEDVAVAAKINTIGGFSAHAGRTGLLEWLRNIKDPATVFVVHGEKESTDAFAEAIGDTYGFKTEKPQNGDSFEL
jgi:metallo-beta-lactamase family protein